MKKILIIEDDIALRKELQTLLERNGYETGIVEDFSNACREMLVQCADLILLDINLPGVDGENLLRQFRKESDTPVIMVTSKNTEMDEVICMSYGADDFIAKPYHPSILLLHIEAVFKRMQHGENKLTYGNMVVDTDSFVDDNTLTVNMNRVRKKLEENGMADIIRTKRGQGYILG